jgi:hypothetical protein
MFRRWKTLIAIIALPAILAIGYPVYSAVTGEVMLNTQDANTTSYLKPKRVHDAGTAGDAKADGILATGLYQYNGATWDRVRGDLTNGIAVDVTRISGSTTSVGNKTPADGYTNPTDAVDNNSLNSEFNGTTWDRVRHSFFQSTTGIASNAAGASVAMLTSPMSEYTMVIDRTAGSTDVVEIDLECSLDNAIFTQIGTVITLVAEPTFTNVNGIPCYYVRYNVVDIGSGNTVTVQILATR